MKKTKFVSLFLCLSLSFTLAACGSSSTTSDGSAAETVETEQTAEYIDAEYEGMSFQYPSAATYSESDDSASITFEESNRVAVIMPHDYSEYEEDSAELIYEFSILSAISGFDEQQDFEDFDTTIAGLDALGANVLVESSGTWLSCNLVSVWNQDTNMQYTIMYAASEDAEEDSSDYEEFLESISFE